MALATEQSNKREEELYMTGSATLIEDQKTRDLITESAAHTVHDSDWLFEFEIEHAMTAHWEKQGQPDTYAVRRFWHAA